MTEIGECIKNLRLKKQWSQLEMARALGISVAEVSQIENNISSVTIFRLNEIANLFNLTFLELVSMEIDKLQISNQVLQDKLNLKEEELNNVHRKWIELYHKIKSSTP